MSTVILGVLVFRHFNVHTGVGVFTKLLSIAATPLKDVGLVGAGIRHTERLFLGTVLTRCWQYRCAGWTFESIADGITWMTAWPDQHVAMANGLGRDSFPRRASSIN